MHPRSNNSPRRYDVLNAAHSRGTQKSALVFRYQWYTRDVPEAKRLRCRKCGTSKWLEPMAEYSIG
ncbi:MAG TPA: hypothetical protein VFI73_04810 [Candidatus Nitrosopolaris sp.]|nr:hypothetical protein [Candidatus Nitrosopolaris sp.]